MNAVNQVLYSRPTLSDGIPKNQPVQSGSGVLVHEDNWREVELLSWSQERTALALLNEIGELEHSKGDKSGYTRIVIRKGIDRPLLDQSIELDALKRALQCQKEMDGIFLLPGPRRVDDGFAFMCPVDLVVFGTAQDGFVCELCLDHMPATESEAMSLLRKVQFRQKTILVEWSRRQVEFLGPSE